MKNFKIFITTIILISIFTLHMPLEAVAINNNENDDIGKKAANYLAKLDIYQGYDDGSLGLDNNITRAEFATLAVRMIGLENEAEKNHDETDFTDVSTDFWGSGYINIAAEKGLIKGYDDNTFKPQNNISYAEAITMIIRILGYEDKTTGEWPDSHIKKANDLNITDNISLADEHIVNREEVAIIIYNSLDVTIMDF